jgi:hypothetical protein
VLYSGQPLGCRGIEKQRSKARQNIMNLGAVKLAQACRGFIPVFLVLVLPCNLLTTVAGWQFKLKIRNTCQIIFYYFYRSPPVKV